MSYNRKRLLSAFGGMREIVHHDPEKPDDLIVETVQDCTDILATAKMLGEQSPGKDFRHVACVPLFFLDQWAKDGSLHDKKHWKKFLNDPSNKLFRTWPGRV